MTVYQKANLARKEWKPVSPTRLESCTNGAEDTLSRCLALRVLELPVKTLILDGLERTEKALLTEEAIETLLRNTQDEERHDTALANCTAVFSNYDSSYEEEANAIAQRWMDHPDHWATKVATLENGVFFVILPIYRQFGGPSLRVTSVDISSDERIHVQTHRHTAKLIGRRPSASLDRLRQDTVAWFLERFKVPGFSAASFQKASDELMRKGITQELDFTKSYQLPAFFERDNKSLPYYTA
ncbi:ferritin-like domain-containing protein [Chroococcidiopsis sp.]|uniref:ferritin-like domain-containing protein n=1 Tax=Chroococcidiopsis sp. TaxID=3088168 RepID=UPI003F32084D